MMIELVAVWLIICGCLGFIVCLGIVIHDDEFGVAGNRMVVVLMIMMMMMTMTTSQLKELINCNKNRGAEDESDSKMYDAWLDYRSCWARLMSLGPLN